MKAIGLDIGGTKIAAGLVDVDRGRPIGRLRCIPTEAHRGGAAVLQKVIDLVNELRAEGARRRIEPKRIGVGLPELVSSDGVLISDESFHWKKLHAVKKLNAILPTVFEADVRAGAIAEARFGGGIGLNSFIYVTIGTGISCSLVIDGRPYLGWRGRTGTFASAPTVAPLFDTSLAPCIPLEEFSSGQGLTRRYAVRTGETIDAKALLSRARTGDTIARQIVETGGRALGSAIAQLVNTLDPECVVIGGGLGCAKGKFYALQSAFKEHRWSRYYSDVPLFQSELRHGAVIGAALATVS
jgi:glucokinase